MDDFPQGSPEWHAIRLGRVTASRVHDVIAKTKSGYTAGRANYEAELIAERLTGMPADRFVNDAMRWGTETEAQARAAYSFLQDVDVAEVGFVPHPTIEMAGASPDGLVGDDGLLEIKCPNTATHLATLFGATIPVKYASQMQWQLACTGRQWCDWVSFDPRMPERHQLFVQRVPRDDAIIAAMEDEVRAFLFEIERKIRRLEAA